MGLRRLALLSPFNRGKEFGGGGRFHNISHRTCLEGGAPDIAIIGLRHEDDLSLLTMAWTKAFSASCRMTKAMTRNSPTIRFPR